MSHSAGDKLGHYLRPLHTVCMFLACVTMPLRAQSSGPPVRFQAQYTKIYSDDVETVSPVAGQGFVLDAPGSFTTLTSEVISGQRSIKGSYSGAGSHTTFMHTTIALAPNHAYRVTFPNRIVTTPDQGFDVLFFSSTAYNAGVNCCIGGNAVNGKAGDTGTFNMTTTLGPYSDYQAWFQLVGTGAIVIDNVQLIDAATNAVIGTADAEQQAIGPMPGLNGGEVTTDPALVIAGKASLRLRNGKGMSTNPAVIPLAGNTTYIIEFQYHVLIPDSTNASLLGLSLFPVDIAFNSSLGVYMPPLLKNATPTGTFSSGALTAGRSSYALGIYSSSQSDVVIDNIAIYRQDAAQTSVTPSAWARLESAPYPRLGSRMYFTSTGEAVDAQGNRYLFSVDQIENRLAFFDVMAAMLPEAQTQSPDYLKRLRAVNPNVIILPNHLTAQQDVMPSAPLGATVDLDYTFWQGIPDEWYLRDSKGAYVPDPDYPPFRTMNISPSSPVVGGQTYYGYLVSWLNTKVFPSGVWDGIFFDDLFARTNIHLLNSNNPSLFDVDYERKGVRGETIAWVSDMTSAATAAMLQQLRQTNGDQQLIMGNAGRLPELSMAPYVNGYLFECSNLDWNGFFPADFWRRTFEYYRRMQAAVRSPRVMLMEGCGATSGPEPYSETPTAADFRSERMTMGTALLGDAYYIYDLHGGMTPPIWYDEYSVDYASGTAVEDTSKKGYLGLSLADAAELTAPSALVFDEGFEKNSVPPTFTISPANPQGSSVTVSQTPGEVLDGAGSLVISNSDHTQLATTSVTLSPAVQGAGAYYLEYDWRILETLDGSFAASTPGGNVPHWDVLKGSSGTAHRPFVVSNNGPITIQFAINRGGGKVSIDNMRIYRGGVGPWRRDFENGFVLVNSLEQPHTFSASELAGRFSRTNIRRIKGSQAPDVNNGQPITGDLTLGPMDAIVLLADRIAVSAPLITAVANAAGGQPGVAAGSFVSIYGSNFTPLPYDDWSKSIFSGQLPKELDGIRVTVGGKPAFINAVTPGQINIQAPDVGAGPMDVVVTTPGGVSAAFSTTAQSYSPAFFPWPGNQPVATHADYTLAVKNGTFPGTTTVPAKPGEIITLWGTGFGPTNPAVPAGQEPVVLAPATQSNVTVSVGGVPVPVLGAVLSAYAATYQVAIQIPGSMADGSYPLVALVNGAQSPTTILLAVQQ
jgi:uncharacterized protein (TIGR03437 family)